MAQLNYNSLVQPGVYSKIMTESEKAANTNESLEQVSLKEIVACEYCEQEGADFVTRCGHNFHNYCLFIYTQEIIENKCPVCDGPATSEETEEELIIKFNEGKINLADLDKDEMKIICKSILQSKRKDFEDILTQIFELMDLKAYCLYEAAETEHLEAVKWIRERVDKCDYSRILESGGIRDDRELIKYVLELEESLIDADDRSSFMKGIFGLFNVESNDLPDYCLKNYVFLLACKVGDIGMVEKLLERGAEVDAKDSLDRTAFYYAANNSSNPEIIDFLASKGLKVVEIPSTLVLSQIDYRQDSSFELAEKLIRLGAKVKLDKGQTCDDLQPGEKACKAENLKCYQMFLKNGLDIEETFGEKKLTAFLILAEYSDKLDSLKELIALGANCKAVDHLGRNALHLVCSGCQSAKYLEYLISLGLDVNSIDNEGYSVLHHALKSLNRSCCNRWGAFSDNIVNISRKAVTKLLNILIAHGANVNLPDAKGQPPIHLLCEFAHTGILEFLVANGADINSTDSDGQTIGHVVCKIAYEKHFPFLEKAIELGLDFEAHDDWGKAALDYCKQKKFIEFIKAHLGKNVR